MNTKTLKILVIALGLVVLATTSQAALQAVDPGPYTAATGFFPLWYRDATGTTLDLCLSKAVSSRPAAAGGLMCTLLPNPGVFDDTLPVVFPFNFPDEAFWFTADALIVDAATGIDLTYISAVEAAFGGPDGLPAPGDQISFARIRIRVDVAVAGTYVVTHPFGVETFDVAAPGRRAINMTRDIGIGATGVFTGALGGDVGPFLRSVNGPYQETNPDTGEVETFIGDPNIEEPVNGSILNDAAGDPQNYVRIQGPNGIDLRTDLFTVSGRIWNNKVPTAVTVDRSSYARNSNGTSIDVFATSALSAAVTFRQTLALGAELSMTGDGLGSFFGRDPAAPTALPPYVIVSAANPPATTPTSLASSLVDVVKIGRAVYTKDTQTLIVEATSSDEVVVPTLRALGLGVLNPAQNPQQLVLEPLAEPPAFVTVKSSAGGSDTEPVVVLPSLNLNPLAVDDSAATDAGQSVDINVLANDSDPDSDLPLLVASVTAPANGQADIISNSTAVRYTPNAGFTGTDSFTYVAVDQRGGLSNAATVTITVRAPNVPPVANADSATTPEDTPVSISFATLLSNDTDANGDTLTVTAAGSPVNGTVVINGNNAVFTPSPNFNGSASFSYSISDGRGGTASATVNVTVTPVNDPPVAGPDSVTTAEDTSVTIPFATLLANDSDVDGDTLTVSAVGGALNGSAVINGISVVFTPAPNFFGTAGFTYTLSDGSGGTAPGAVSVTVTPVNDAPVAVNDSATTTSGVPVTINVLANDTDVEGNPLTIVNLTQPATGGSVAINGASVLFTPAAGFTGGAGFTYQARDSGGADSNVANVSVTVNAAPLADYNITRFSTNNNVRVSRNQVITVTLSVRNIGAVNAPVSALLQGTQNGSQVYSSNLNLADPVGGGATTISVSTFAPTLVANVNWTVTFQDASGANTATTVTSVRP